MHRKVLITALMLGICVAGFSQTSEVKSNPKELAKSAVVKEQKEWLDVMQRRLKDDKGKTGIELGDKNAQQFLYQEDLIDSILDTKSHNLREVFNKLCKKSNMPTEFIYRDIKIKGIDYGKKGKEEIDSNLFIVTVSFEAHTKAKENVSNVKYDVTSNWAVRVKAKKGKEDGILTIVGYNVNGTPDFVTSIAKPIDYLGSEKEAMKTAAKKAIVEWYANLPQTLDKQYVEQSVAAIEPMNVSSNDIVFGLPESQSFKVTEVPTIKVDIDPYQFIRDEDKSLYTEPTAYINVAPIFNVSIDDSFKNAELSVSYVVKDTIKRLNPNEIESQLSLANAVVEDFAKKLSSYVSSRDNDQKTVLENMFENAESVVEVSNLPKDGTETVKTKSAQKYLSLLKGTSLTINNIKLEDEDSLIYSIDQEYRSKAYSDCTKKRIYLIHDTTKDTYVISRIEVVKNSTSRISE